MGLRRIAFGAVLFVASLSASSTFYEARAATTAPATTKATQVTLGRVSNAGPWIIRRSAAANRPSGRFHTTVAVRSTHRAYVCVRLRVLTGTHVVSRRASCKTVRGSLRLVLSARNPHRTVMAEVGLRVQDRGSRVHVARTQLRFTRIESSTSSSVSARKASDPTPATRFWADRIPADAAYDPNSNAMVALIQQAADSQGFLIAARKWSIPVYHADQTTPQNAVNLTSPWAPLQLLTGVPFPTDTTASPDGDGHLAIIDDTTNCEYDLYKATKNPDGSWTAGWATAFNMNQSNGWIDWPATGSGDALTAGLITPEEMNAGTIRHALKFSFPFTKAGGPVRPATASDGTHTDPGAIPEGAHLQLDPNLDLATLNLSPWQTTIAQALQTYGMYLTDTGGGVSIPAQEPNQNQTYPWGTDTYAYLPESLVSHLKVLSLPSQYNPQPPDPSSTCAAYS